jgi:hypothetical protein
MKKEFCFVLEEEHIGKRLDVVLTALTGINRSNLKNHMTKLFLNGKAVKLSFSKTAIGDKVELGGTFCMGKCQKGVCVTVGDAFYSVAPETTEEFFEKEVLGKI